MSELSPVARAVAEAIAIVRADESAEWGAEDFAASSAGEVLEAIVDSIRAALETVDQPFDPAQFEITTGRE